MEPYRTLHLFFVWTGTGDGFEKLAEFGWYDPVWYSNYKPDDDAQTVHLGRYLGPSFEFGQELCYKVLNKNACVLHRSSVFALSDEDRRSALVTERLAKLDEGIRSHLVCTEADAVDPFDSDKLETPQFETYGEVVPSRDEWNEPSTPEADDWDHNAFGMYIGAELLLPCDGVLAKGLVTVCWQRVVCVRGSVMAMET
jgi:hypothetical protein